MIEFKTLVLGDDGPTKEAFFKRLLDMDLLFYTTRGPITFNVRDAAGESKFGMLPKEPFIPAESAIIINENEISTKGKIRKALEDKPTIICGRKKDLKDFIRKKGKNEYFYDITSPNFVYPFLWLGAQLLGDVELEVVPMPAQMPKEVKLTEEQRQQMERDLEEAQEIPLPE